MLLIFMVILYLFDFIVFLFHGEPFLGQKKAPFAAWFGVCFTRQPTLCIRERS